ncbi:hypothetical protein N8T08_002067 [Aspergillus melleus]|uniref:Uncharacterized protein n=1 Tax=Aspergillus melleus TaxID=138277 RepID=A0ACC3AMG4_9EURO|nr:hypothetical protein N8T08_002067 [Aspergillus melleus]
MKKITQLERLASLDDLYNKMQATFKKDPSNIFAYIAMFYQIYCTNGQTYLKKDLDNSKHPKVIPIIFKGFLQTHKMEDLADAYQNAGSAGNSTGIWSSRSNSSNLGLTGWL